MTVRQAMFFLARNGQPITSESIGKLTASKPRPDGKPLHAALAAVNADGRASLGWRISGTYDAIWEGQLRAQRNAPTDVARLMHPIIQHVKMPVKRAPKSGRKSSFPLYERQDLPQRLMQPARDCLTFRQ